MISKWGWDGERGGGGRGGRGEKRKGVLALLLVFNRWTDAVLFPPLSLSVQFVYLIFSPLCAVCASSELVP